MARLINPVAPPRKTTGDKLRKRDIWTELEDRVASIPDYPAHIATLRRRMCRSHPKEARLGNINTPAIREKLLEYLSREIEIEHCARRLERLRDLRGVRLRDLWLEIFGEIGEDSSDHLAFDPDVMAVFCLEPLGEKASSSSSLTETFQEYRRAIKVALYQPLNAGAMVMDPALPDWLRELAGHLTRGQLSPGLRKVLDECLRDPHLAQEWHNQATEANLPPWLKEIFRILGSPELASEEPLTT